MKKKKEEVKVLFKGFYKKNFSAYTALILIALLIGYYAFVLIVNNNIVEQVKGIQQHPFPVREAAGELKTDFMVLRKLSEHLGHDRSMSLLENTQHHFDQVDTLIKANIAIINAKCISEPES